MLVGGPSQFTVIFLDWVKVAGLHAAAASQIKLGRKMRMVLKQTGASWCKGGIIDEQFRPVMFSIAETVHQILPSCS
jgi:hypothetical protein